MPVFLDRARAHFESGLYFDPPHDQAFRLSESTLATSLFKRFGVQEMDFGWWDEARQTMNLLEVKDYSQGDFAPEHYLNECLQKATDCLLLLASIWHELRYGDEVRACLPDEWHARPGPERPLHLYFVIKERVVTGGRGGRIAVAGSGDPIGMDALQAKARNKLRGRTELFNVLPATMVFFMDHRTAASRGLPIRTEGEVTGRPEPTRPTRRPRR